MILRIAAALTLLAGLGALAAYLHMIGRFPTASEAARHLRAMKNRVAAPREVTPATYAAFAAMPRHARLPDYAPRERRAVSLEGDIQRMLRAADDDIHLELAPVPRQPGDPNVGYVTAEITPQWRSGSDAWSYDRLVQAFHPNHGGTTAWDGGTRRVRISGWLLYDYEYEDAPAYGQPRISSWEIHPVTRIELWSDSLGRFADYAR